MRTHKRYHFCWELPLMRKGGVPSWETSLLLCGEDRKILPGVYKVLQTLPNCPLSPVVQLSLLTRCGTQGAVILNQEKGNLQRGDVIVPGPTAGSQRR